MARLRKGLGIPVPLGLGTHQEWKGCLPRLAPLYVTADAVCLCIYSTPPSTSGPHVEDLNCDLLLREFCAAFVT
jgi:hypothetical protein